MAVVHRGLHEPAGLPAMWGIHVERGDLVERRGELLEFEAGAAVDLAAMTAGDAEVALEAIGSSAPLVAASSCDVYGSPSRSSKASSPISMGPGTFLWSRRYAPEIARGLRLAVNSGLE